MAQVVRHRPFTKDDRVRPRASSCKIYGVQDGTWTRRSGTSPVSRQDHSDSVPHPYYREDTLAKPGNPADTSVLSETTEHWLEQ